MEFRDWEPVYERILKDFGYSRLEDDRAARLLATLASGKTLCDCDCLTETFGEHATIVAGPSRSGKHVFDLIEGTTLTVGIGTSLLLEEGIVPDLVVTDLDGDVVTDLEANSKGAVLVVHAHGDNIPALNRFVPSVHGCMVLTTQSTPFGIVHDFGGFTDGDRAVALAAHFGVCNMRLIGFDFNHPRSKIGSSMKIKAKKLRWAEMVIDQIATKNGVTIEYL